MAVLLSYASYATTVQEEVGNIGTTYSATGKAGIAGSAGAVNITGSQYGILYDAAGKTTITVGLRVRFNNLVGVDTIALTGGSTKDKAYGFWTDGTALNLGSGASVPGYSQVATLAVGQEAVLVLQVEAVASAHLRPGDWLVDLGTSRGESVAGIVDRFGATIHYTLVETSAPMLDAVRQRYAGYIDAKVMEVLDVDLRAHFPVRPARVVLSVLTLQFVPINYRQRIVQRVYDSLRPGGAFILVEKVLGTGAEIDDLMVRTYHDLKAANGYPYDVVDRKRESLEGVLVPVTAGWNEELLRQAGFSQVDCFWRWMSFGAWVAVKRELPGLPSV